ncbi:MAG TPA: membrane protein insertase YidC [bacterium]|nr:membrane protein insertase YidC [bacterium]
MKDQHRSLIAAALSFLVLIGWYYFYGSKSSMVTPPTAATSTAASPAPQVSQTVSPAPAAGDASVTRPETLTLKETPLMTLEWASHGGRLSNIFLKKYRQDVKKDSLPVNLLPFPEEKSLDLLCLDCNAALPPDGSYETASADLGANKDRTIAFEAATEGLKVTKTYDWSEDGYLLNLKVAVENRSAQDFRGKLGLGWRARQFPPKPKGFLSFLQGPGDHRGFLYRLGTDVKHVAVLKEPSDLRGQVPWGGIEDRYFLISLISRRDSPDQLLQIRNEGDFLNLALYPGEVSIPAQGRHEENFSFYAGPKEREYLLRAGVGLEKAVDYGWFSVLAIPILKLLQVFHVAVKNWGLAVIVLTLVIKLVMNPLTVKSMKQMKEMQKLQPKLAALKDKYKDDRQRLNAETMALFRSHNVNPVGGCLPMLMQMPIYIALYKVLYNAIELRHAPFVGFYRDLSGPDPYFILPVLLGISMVLQQKLTPSASADPTQKQMMMIMPVMFTAFMLFLPVGLVLYIFVNTAFSVLQQWMYQKGIRWRDLLKGQRPQAVL